MVRLEPCEKSCLGGPSFLSGQLVGTGAPHLENLWVGQGRGEIYVLLTFCVLT